MPDPVFPIRVTADVTIPRVPNFLLCPEPGDNSVERAKVSIADVEDSTLSKIADRWKVNLLARAAELRALRDA